MTFGTRFREKSTTQPSSYVGKGTIHYNNPNVPDETHNFVSGAGANAPLLHVKRCWDETHPGPPYRTGGPLTIVSGSYPLYQVKGSVKWDRVLNRSYEGGFTPGGVHSSGPLADWIQDAGLALPYDRDWMDASDYGNEAYLDARPKLESVDLGTAIGELRDLPGMLKQTAGLFKNIYKRLGGNTSTPFMSPKTVADTFLNHQFGWKPFIGDIRKTHNTVDNQRKLLDNIERRNGKLIRRVRLIQQNQNTTKVDRLYLPWVFPYSEFVANLLPARVIDGFGCRGYTDVYRHTADVVWFEGAFKFYLASFDRKDEFYDTPVAKFHRYATLYGLRISPVTLYNLTPWSWLADWFTNLGKQLEYLNSQLYDGLVSPYAYVMRTREEVTTQEVIIFNPDKYGGETKVSWDFLVNSKDRRAAESPYGFSVKQESLSARQLAILAALGISKASR